MHCDAIESWSEYDENGNRIYYLQSYRRFGRDPRLDRISEYDKNDNLIYTQFSNGTRCWYEYDSRGKQVASKKIIWDQIDKKEILV